MSQLQVDTILNTNGDGAPDFPNGMTVTGVITATTLNQNVTGIITAASLDIGGNITAGTGIDVSAGGVNVVGGGINAVGTITATSYSGDGSALSGVSGYTATASTISGPIGASKPIVINSDGTVGVITGFESILGAPVQMAGESAYFESNMNTGAGSISGNGVFVVGYKDGANNYLWAKVGTVAGAGNSTTTWGTRVQVNGTNTWSHGDIVHIPGTNKVVFLFSDASSSTEGSCVVGEVSGTTITFGSKTTFRSGSACYNIRGTWDPDSERILVAYRDQGDSGRGSLSVGAVSGDTCTFNGNFNFSDNEIVVSSDGTLGICYDTKNNQVVINYKAQTADRAMFAVGTIALNGSVYEATLANQSPETKGTTSPSYVDCVYDIKNVVVVFSDVQPIDGINKVVSRAGRGVAVGSSIPYAMGASVIADTGNTYASNSDIVYNSAAGRAVISYSNHNDGQKMYTAVLDVGLSTSLTISAARAVTTYDASNYGGQVLGYNADINRIMIVTRNTNNYGDATVQGVRISNASPGNFLGFSADAYTDGQTASIKIVGQQSHGHSDLLIGNRYYVLGNGNLSIADDGESINAGIAVSSTSLIVKG